MAGILRTMKNKVRVVVEIMDEDKRQELIYGFVDRNVWNGLDDDGKVTYINKLAGDYYLQKRHDEKHNK